jgi:hypothetical protein
MSGGCPATCAPWAPLMSEGARPVRPRPPSPGSFPARALEHSRTFEFHGWLAQQPPEARAIAALAEAELEAIVVAFALGNAREP